MRKIWAFIRHNSGIVIGIIIIIMILAWCHGCESQVVSITNAPRLVNRAGLELEVDHFLKSAELRFIELDQEDEFKRAIFAAAMEFMSQGKINPLAIAITLGNILGIGAVIDNVRKRTYINTLKGDTYAKKIDREVKAKVSKIET